MKKATKLRAALVLAALAAAACGWAAAQEKAEQPDRAVVPLSNPSKPATLEVSLMRGSITVKAYEGKDVIVEARVREKALNILVQGVPFPDAPPALPAVPLIAQDSKAAEELRKQLIAQTKRSQAAAELALGLYYDQTRLDKERQEEKKKKIAGMKQISGSMSGLEIEEENNVVQVSARSFKAATDLTIQVPYATSVNVRTNMDGSVVIEGVSGEVDVNNMNGSVTLKNVSGNALVHTVGGDIEAVLSRLGADKPLSFSTMNGDIDITLPADVKASLKMKTDQGEVYTDFEVNMTRRAAQAETPEKTEQGKYRITFDKSLYGTINGGGQEISFNTFTGDIFIRKKK